ncbi:MAG: glycosyltransferase family 4 protein, partial [Bdellovibrionales bacterium]|nr:glycosyltransferase family 4 protein [Bdellovibrionales bacterium]
KIKVVPNAFVHHKGAPSQVRNYYMMTRSQVYYAKINSKGIYTPEETELLLQPEIEEFRLNLHDAYDRSLISEKEKNERLALIDKGWKEGEIAAENFETRKFIDISKINNPEKNFKRVKTRKENKQKMVICLLSQNYPPKVCGGIGRWTHELAVELSRRGHDIHVLTKSDTINSVDYEEGVWVHRLLPKAADMSLLKDNLTLPDWIKNHSYAVYKEVQRINQHHKVDIIHAPIYDLEGLFCVNDENFLTVTSLQTTFKTMIESHPEWKANKEFWEYVVLNMIKGEAWLLDKTRYILGISDAICQAMPTYYGTEIDKKDVEILPLGIKDCSNDFSALRKDDKIQILYVGRLEPRKGIDILLSVIPDILLDYPNVEFNIVGSSSYRLANGLSYREAFESQFKNLDWFSRVNFTGEVDDSTLNQLYANCDIFVAPSRFESFGLIYLEAMRFTKPVIGSRAGGIIEIIRENQTGLLVEPGDSFSLKEKLELLINNPELRVNISKNAREIYEQEYTVTAMADRYESYFRRITKKDSDFSKNQSMQNLNPVSLLL